MKPIIITGRLLFEALKQKHKGQLDNHAQYKVCVAFPTSVQNGICDWLDKNDFKIPATITKARLKIKEVDNSKFIELESDLTRCLWLSSDYEIPVPNGQELHNGDYVKVKLNVKEHSNKWGVSPIYSPMAIVKVQDGKRVLKEFNPFEGMGVEVEATPF